MTTVEVLRKAREMCVHRWVQGGKNACGVCAQLAIDRACHSSVNERAIAERVFCETVGVPVGYADIWRWNDAPGRTKDEVLAAFDRAIAACEDSTNAQR